MVLLSRLPTHRRWIVPAGPRVRFVYILGMCSPVPDDRLVS